MKMGIINKSRKTQTEKKITDKKYSVSAPITQKEIALKLN